MKNPKKLKSRPDGFLSKKDHANLVRMIDDRIKIIINDFKTNMDAYEDFEKTHGDIGAYDKQVQYDQGFYDGAMSSLTAIKSDIVTLFELDQKQRNKAYIQGKFKKLFNTFGSIFRFFSFRL